MISLVLGAVLSLATVSNLKVNISYAVAPEKVSDEAPTKEGVNLLPTPLKVITTVTGNISLFSEDKRLEASEAPALNTVIQNSSPRLKDFGLPSIKDNGRLVSSVFLQLGGQPVFGRSGRFFNDLLLTQTNCPDFTNDVANCKINFPAIQIFSAEADQAQSIPSGVTKIKIRIFRESALRRKQLENFSLSEGDNIDDYIERYARNAEGKALTKDEAMKSEKPRGTINAFFLYSRYVFDAAIEKPLDEAKKTDSQFEERFALSQASSRIPVLSRVNASWAGPDRYLIEREIESKDKGSQVDHAIVDVTAGGFIQPADLKYFQ